MTLIQEVMFSSLAGSKSRWGLTRTFPPMILLKISLHGKVLTFFITGEMSFNSRNFRLLYFIPNIRGQKKMSWLDGVTDSMDMSFEQTLGDSEGKGSLACYSSWGCTTYQLNNHNK